MERLRLDGNAAAGTLGEIFSFEATTAEYGCPGCGRSGTLGEAMVYEVRGLGTVVRCPGCDNALIRLSRIAVGPSCTSEERATSRPVRSAKERRSPARGDDDLATRKKRLPF